MCSSTSVKLCVALFINFFFLLPCTMGTFTVKRINITLDKTRWTELFTPNHAVKAIRRLDTRVNTSLAVSNMTGLNKSFCANTAFFCMLSDRISVSHLFLTRSFTRFVSIVKKTTVGTMIQL
jgi:hypothetical protein